MAFDADKFTAAAKQAGYSDEDIQSEIQRQTKNINAATGQEFGKAGEAAVQDKAQELRNQGSPMPGTKAPEDVRSLGQSLIDWASTPEGNAVLGGLGLAAAAGLGIKDRMKKTEAAPRVEPYVAPSYDFETTAREVPQRPGLPQPSAPAPQTATPAPTAPTPSPTYPAGATQQPSISGYGQTTLNAPTGAPNVAVAPPAAQATPVEPKPLSELEQLRIEKARFDLEAARAKEARAAEAHANRLAADAKKTEATLQNKTSPVKSSLSPQEWEMVKKSNEAKINKDIIASQQAAAKAAAVPPAAPVTPAAPAAPTPATPTPAAVTPSTVQTTSADFEQKLGKPTIQTGSGMPAYQAEGGEKAKMRKEFSSMKDVPQGYVFVPGGQNMDIVRNAVGQEAFTTKLGEFGGYPKTTEAAYEQSRAINKSLGRLSREEAKAAGTAMGDVTPSITKKVAGSKLVKVAGVGGALISLADVANAKEAANVIAESLLPLGMTPSELASGTLTEKQLKAFKESQKLGSPYRSVPPPQR